MLPIGVCAQAACILEATARKPGNVHRFADFPPLSLLRGRGAGGEGPSASPEDALTYLDFLLSAAAIGSILDSANSRSVGANIFECIRATRQVVSTNTNLGIVLLLAPLAAIPRAQDLRSNIESILAALTRDDARLAYEAIRLSMPGGMGEVPEQDIRAEPTETLRAVMALAADRDSIARQYANGFRDVLNMGVPALTAALRETDSVEEAIIRCHLEWMTRYPDSLIARKWGAEIAADVQRRAEAVLASGPSANVRAEFDAWLRQHRYNPGTSADLVTACLFVALRDDTMKLPARFATATGSTP